MIKHYVAVTGGTDTEQTKSIATLSYAISAITKASNAQVTTSVAHGLSVGDHIVFFSVGGMTQMNSGNANYETGTIKRVASVIDANNFTVDIDSTGFSTYTSGGTVYSVGVKRNNPGEITSAGHGLQNGQKIYISGVGGSTQVNGSFYIVSDATTNCFRVKGTNGNYVNWAGVTAYSSGGTITLYNRLITAISKANPCQVTCPNHGLSTGNRVYINDVGGMVEVNELGYQITVVDANNFTLDGVNSSAFTTYTSGGTVRQAYATVNACVSSLNTNSSEEIQTEKTTAPTQYTSANLTWAFNNNVVNTSASLIGSIQANDYISRVSDAGDGNEEMIYRVLSITTSTIVLESKYRGTNGTDTASVYKYNPNTSMVGANGVTGINLNKGVILKGGYDFSTLTKNGQSVFKHNGARTSSSNVGLFVGSGAEAHYINFVEAYYACQHGGNCDIRNCSFVGGYAYTLYSNTTSSSYVLENVAIGANSASSWPAWLCQIAPLSVTNVKVVSFNSTTGQAIGFASGYYDFNNEVDVRASGYGLYTNVSNTILKNMIAEYCNLNAYITSNAVNRHIFDSKLNYGNYGVALGTTGSQSIIKGCEMKGNAIRGIDLSQFSGLIFEDNDFENNARDFYMDQYSGSVLSINNRHATPSLYAYDRAFNAGTMTIIGCSIDTPSLAKAMNITAGDYLVLPQYNLQNSFGMSGRIYGRGSVLQDTGTLLPNGNHSTAITLTSVISTNYADWVVDSIYVRSSVAQSIEYVVRANGVWSGTIVPKLKLNGKVIKTGTAITGISNGSYDTKTISVTAGEVTEDGVLSLEFECNNNTVTINTGIISVT